MSDDSQLIRKLREAVDASKSWPDSMKKLHGIRQKADLYFSEREKAPPSGEKKIAKTP